MKAAARNYWLHVLLLLLWIFIGLGLRFIHLDSKPLWTDEFSTIVFSLGNSFQAVPLNQVISSEALLEPLKPQAGATVSAVVKRLFQESNHPPLYFILTHFWLKLFPVDANGLVTAWGARSLAALIGTVTIPAAFALGWFAFRSRLIAQVAAALMAVSPFGIYLSQEARHYTLPILWILISLCCLVASARLLRDRAILPLPLCLLWIGANGLGMATHYFFAFTLGAEAIVIISLGLLQSWRERGIWYPSSHWQRMWIVAIGTLATSIVWLPRLQDLQGSELTRWIQQSDWQGLSWLEPIGQSLASWITMLYLLPIQTENEVVLGLSVAGLVLLVLWTAPKLYRGLKAQYLDREVRLGIMVLGVFVAAAVVLFFSVTYFLEIDLTSAFRYNFVYFPGMVLLIGAGLASGWNVATQIAQSRAVHVPTELLGVLRINNRKTVILIWILSLVGAITVLSNLGYQKTHRPDVVAEAIVAEAIRQASQGDVLIAIPHQTHGQTGRMMGIALSLQQQPSAPSLQPSFLLASAGQNAISTLQQAVNELNLPTLDLWLINGQELPEADWEQFLKQESCHAKTKAQSVDGYRYRLYRCLNRPARRPARSNPRSRQDDLEEESRQD